MRSGFLMTPRDAGWVDVTLPLREGMPVWPGEVAPLIRRTTRISVGEGVNVWLFCIGAHMGTHLDGRNRFLEGEAGHAQ